MHDTRHNWHQLIKSDNPNEKNQYLKKQMKKKEGTQNQLPLHETSQGMNQPSYLSPTSDTP